MVDLNWSELPPLSTLRAFEATARLQGYSAAARSLNVTPAAVSQQVRKLEAEVGASLVRRKGRGLVLTDEGRALAAPLREAFAMIAQGIDDLKLREATRGVRVSTTDFFVNAVILPSLGAFWKEHPTLQVSFSPEGNTRPVDLDQYDIVVRGGPPGLVWDGAAQTKLLEGPIIICAAPELLGEGKPDLSALPWIIDYGMGFDVLQNAIRRAGCDPDAVEYFDPGGAKFEPDAALMGYGLFLCPKLTIQSYLDSGQLVEVDMPLDMEAVYYAIYRNGAMAKPVAQFLSWLISICEPLSDALDA